MQSAGRTAPECRQRQTRSYLSLRQQLRQQQRRLDGHHGDVVERQELAAAELVGRGGRHHLHYVLNADPELAVLVIARLWG